ncbi:MAG: peptidoglycan-associated lipoprotein Pal [Candidatus Sumerlaeia bacterium]|nr:peptidoglycan-associated lipoprotein Pal [Candidatus Sumerlaeia bacterium]
MLLRSRSALLLFAAAAAALTLTTGCSRSAKGEKRLPGVATSAVGEDSSRTGGQWAAGNGAPGVDGFGSGTGVGRVPGGGNGVGLDGASGLDASGSTPNNPAAGGVELATIAGELDMVHFAYDSYEITPDWQAILEAHAQWITSNPGLDIQIEGHCDERGTEEYNISLGQKRADAVREFLISKGVDGARLSTISYGKMRPLNFDTTEDSHAINRRAMFLVFQPTGNSVASN